MTPNEISALNWDKMSRVVYEVTDPNVLDELAQSYSWFCRLLVAENEHTKNSTLLELSRDSYTDVSDTAFKRLRSRL